MTFEEFKELAYESNYINGRGRTAASLTVDRTVVGKFPGYVKSNISVMSRRKNSAKRWIDYNYLTKEAYVRKYIEPEGEGENPF